MKKTLFLLLIICQSSYAQIKTPEFSMKLYFEDAKGNKDTITFGIDKSIKVGDYSIKPEFGEDIITSPFDTIFDVRVASGWNFSKTPILGNYRITNYEGSTIPFFNISIFIQAKYNPIKITYDYNLLKPINGKWYNRLFLTKTASTELIKDWWKAYDWHCLAGQNPLYVDMEKPKHPSSSKLLTSLLPVTGKKDFQPVRYLLLDQNGSGETCDKIILDTDEANITENLKVFPNPVQQFLNFQVPPSIQYNDLSLLITDMSGKLVLQQSLLNNENQLDVENLNKSIYCLQLIGDNRILGITKFIKID